MLFFTYLILFYHDKICVELSEGNNSMGAQITIAMDAISDRAAFIPKVSHR